MKCSGCGSKECCGADLGPQVEILRTALKALKTAAWDTSVKSLMYQNEGTLKLVNEALDETGGQ